MSKNIKIDADTLSFIRKLDDFDLVMLLSEVNEHGWDKAKELIPFIREAVE